jgi:hypothetical protein
MCLVIEVISIWMIWGLCKSSNSKKSLWLHHHFMLFLSEIRLFALVHLEASLDQHSNCRLTLQPNLPSCTSSSSSKIPFPLTFSFAHWVQAGSIQTPAQEIQLTDSPAASEAWTMLAFKSILLVSRFVTVFDVKTTFHLILIIFYPLQWKLWLCWSPKAFRNNASLSISWKSSLNSQFTSKPFTISPVLAHKKIPAS